MKTNIGTFTPDEYLNEVLTTFHDYCQLNWPRVNLAYQRVDFARASFVNDARTSRNFLEVERARAPCVNDARIFWGKFCLGNDAR